MATVKRFEDLDCWQMANELCRLIFLFTSKEIFSKSYPLKNQIDSSSGSVMDNIAEGFERSGRKEFIQFLSIAKGSAGEVRSQLQRAFDRNFITKDEYEASAILCKRLSASIQSLISYLNSCEIKGIKYKVEDEEQPYFISTPNP